MSMIRPFLLSLAALLIVPATAHAADLITAFLEWTRPHVGQVPGLLDHPPAEAPRAPGDTGELDLALLVEWNVHSGR